MNQSFDVTAAAMRAAATFRQRAGTIVGAVFFVNWLPFFVLQALATWGNGAATSWAAVIGIPLAGALSNLIVVGVALSTPGRGWLRNLPVALAAFVATLPIWLLLSAGGFIRGWIRFAEPPFATTVVAAVFAFGPWVQFALSLAFAGILGLLPPVLVAERRFSFAAYARAFSLMRHIRWPFLAAAVAFGVCQTCILLLESAQLHPGITNGEILLSFAEALIPMLLNAAWAVLLVEAYRSATAAETAPGATAEVFA